MKKITLTWLIISVGFMLPTLIPNTGFAEVNVNIGINVPLPGFVFHGPPAVALIPGTYAYAVPDVEIDILFYHGYWYRPHRDRWYRSASYNGPWGHIAHRRVPAAIIGLPPDYRHFPPGHSRIPYGHVKKNWRNWEKHRHWDTHEYRYDHYERHYDQRHEHGHGGDKHHHKGGKGK